MSEKLDLDLKEFEEEHPTECAFIELMNECGAYKRK